MKLLNTMFKKTVSSSAERNAVSAERERRKRREKQIPHNLLRKCSMCKSAVFTEEIQKGMYICPKCGGYFRMSAKSRIALTVDPGSFERLRIERKAGNPLEYPEYEEKIRGLQEKTGLDDAVLAGKARIGGKTVAIGACDGRFLMASMGAVVGETITELTEMAVRERLPIVLFVCSGGARMQEGIVSLMQMAKTAAALKRHKEAGLLYISVLTDPTMGGVTASFAMLGDIILAEPKALIGFAGPRVIEQTIRQKLPKGFQRSEFLLEHGFVDAVVRREEMKSVLSQILNMHSGTLPENMQEKASEAAVGEPSGGFAASFSSEKPESAWERVKRSRDQHRPTAEAYIGNLFESFIELHGDRCGTDDPAVIGGIAMFGKTPVTVIMQEKGSGTKDCIRHNFGMASPGGYRKALRLMKQAERCGRPVICLVDTPGAFCGLEAEENGQGSVIAECIAEMSALKVPVLSVIIGEGGSGGALALAAADEVWMLENSVYSILSPEGFSSIVWRDSSRAPEAAELMKMTAADLLKAGVIERIIDEPDQFTEETLGYVTEQLQTEISRFLAHYTKLDAENIREHRYRRFRRM